MLTLEDYLEDDDFLKIEPALVKKGTLRISKEERSTKESQIDVLLDECNRIYTKNDGISEIMCNPDGKLFFEINGKTKEHNQTMSENARKLLIKNIAANKDSIVNDQVPFVSARLDTFYNGRFYGVIEPVACNGPFFSIRFPPAKVLTLEALFDLGAITEDQKIELKEIINNKLNLIIAGSTSSGKTTLLNAMLQEITDDRCIIIEDTQEILCNSTNFANLLTTETYKVVDGVRSALRLRPDRIIIGELRYGSEALDFLKGSMTGHPGSISTIHAQSAKDVEQRLIELMQEVVETPDRSMPKRAIQAVVFMKKTQGGKRKVTEIAYWQPNVI